MEEKERYELTDTDCIFDTERDIVVSDVCDVVANADIITNLLNQQDKRTKELEEENKELEIKLDKCGTELVNAESLVSYLENENQQLKQQLAEKDKEIEYQESMKILAVENQNKKAIEQLEKVKSAFGLINSKLDKVETIKEYIYYIDHQIKQLKEMSNEK